MAWFLGHCVSKLRGAARWFRYAATTQRLLNRRHHLLNYDYRKAWQICRSGEDDPSKFGNFNLNGIDFVRGNLIRDVASLNKMELLPWDCWGMILDTHPDDLSILDEIAVLTANDVPEFERVRQHYETDPRLFMDGNLLSYVNGKMEPVNVGL